MSAVRKRSKEQETFCTRHSLLCVRFYVRFCVAFLPSCISAMNVRQLLCVRWDLRRYVWGLVFQSRRTFAWSRGQFLLNIRQMMDFKYRCLFLLCGELARTPSHTKPPSPMNVKPNALDWVAQRGFFPAKPLAGVCC